MVLGRGDRTKTKGRGSAAPASSRVSGEARFNRNWNHGGLTNGRVRALFSRALRRRGPPTLPLTESVYPKGKEYNNPVVATVRTFRILCRGERNKMEHLS